MKKRYRIQWSSIRNASHFICEIDHPGQDMPYDERWFWFQGNNYVGLTYI